MISKLFATIVIGFYIFGKSLSSEILKMMQNRQKKQIKIKTKRFFQKREYRAPEDP